MSSRAVGLLLLFVAVATPAQAQRGRYPQVIGPSGAAYGPTQAEYQYQQRYGRPSPEYRAGGVGMDYVNGYPGVAQYGGYGYHHHGYGNVGAYIGFDLNAWYPPQSYGFAPSTAYYGVAYPYGPYAPQPFLGPATPAFVNDLNANQFNAGFNNGMMNPALVPQAINQANQDAIAALNRQNQVIEPSTPDAQLRSVQWQTQGDDLLKQLSYPAAADRYRKSIDAARDRAEPRIRLGVTYAAQGRYLEAVEQFKLSVVINPQWPQRYESLGSLIGEKNNFEKERVKTRVAEWTLQDARDPNRLFLLGVLMHMDGDPRTSEMFNTAQLISGPQQHLTAFLNVAPVVQPAPSVNNGAVQNGPALNAPAQNGPGINQPFAAPVPNVPPPAGNAPQQLAIPPLPQ